MADIIIIKGAPGSGKSQTAKSLAKFFPRGVKVEVDMLRKMVISVDWTNQQQHIKMLEVAARLVLDFVARQYSPVIVVDTFSGDKINRFLEVLNQGDRALNIRVFSLYVTNEELERRLVSRSGDGFRDLEVSKKINTQVLEEKHVFEEQIDTTGLAAEETVEVICRCLKKGSTPAENIS